MALCAAGLTKVPIDGQPKSIVKELEDMARTGDRSNATRVALAKSLALKAAQPRYEAFLERAPAFIAGQARGRRGQALDRAVDLWSTARRAGLPQSDADLLIAASAIVSRRSLATGNRAHFDWIQGLTIVDWRNAST